jgi:hypothetical protein
VHDGLQQARPWAQAPGEGGQLPRVEVVCGRQPGEPAAPHQKVRRQDVGRVEAEVALEIRDAELAVW